MLNFTVGPVMSSDEVLAVGGTQSPYFRTAEFSKIMLENEKNFLSLLGTDESYKAVFITGSGTASMDAVILNTLSKEDNVLVVNGGSFGERFVQILETYEIPHHVIKCEVGHTLTRAQLDEIDGSKYTAFVVNLHETSTGVLYDINLISEFCQKYNLYLIVDAISCFLTDEFNMIKNHIDVVITGSQKALAVAPGVSLIAMSKRAQERVEASKAPVYYLSLKKHLKDMERGQTPFTPAVNILFQIHARLEQIVRDGGLKASIQHTHELATYFRNSIKHLPFDICSDNLSNAVTPLRPRNVSAYSIFLTLKDEYGIWICPNGGELKDQIFRVGHIGALTKEHYDILLNALNDMNKRGLL